MKTIINLASEVPVLPDFPDWGICILESHHKPGFIMPPSRYNFSEVMLILEGEGYVTHQNIQHPVKRGDIITVPEQTPYFYTDSTRTPLGMLCLCLQALPDYKAILNPVLPVQFKVLRNTNLAREISGHLRSIFYEQSQARDAQVSVIFAQTLLLLAKIMRRSQRSNNERRSSREIDGIVRVQGYIDSLETSFHEIETIESVADRLKMSARCFTHHFRNITGDSRLRYLQQLRLRHARRLLLDTNDSVTSIAFACGFEDLSNFFRVFRIEEKLSPNQWREKHRKKKSSKSA